jgi:Family of unknown function (DUF5670)
MGRSAILIEARGLAPRGKKRGFMLAIIGAVLLLMWILGFTAFHVTSGLIHILLVLAVISVIMHFVRGKTATT